MNVIKGMSIFWILYGIAGLFGFLNIPSKFKGYSWTKEYIRSQGITWILLGVPYFVLSFVLPAYLPNMDSRNSTVAIVIIALGMPAFIYSMVIDRKYKALIKKERDEASNE